MAPYKQEPYLVLIGLDSAHHLCQRHFVRCTHHVRNIMLAPKIITQYPFKANKSEFVDLVVFLTVSMKISIFQIDRL